MQPLEEEGIINANGTDVGGVTNTSVAVKVKKTASISPNKTSKSRYLMTRKRTAAVAVQSKDGVAVDTTDDNLLNKQFGHHANLKQIIQF